MPDIRPFRALRYDPATIADLALVVAPPYDVIPEEALAVYRQRSPYNVVRLIRPGTEVVPGALVGATRTRLGATHVVNAELTGVTPTPLREIVAGEFVALLSTDTLPVTLPAAVGVNAGLSAMDWLGVRTVAGVTPVALNPAPVTVTLEIVTFELPVFVSVAANELVLPMFTFPKFKLVGLALIR